MGEVSSLPDLVKLYDEGAVLHHKQAANVVVGPPQVADCLCENGWIETRRRSFTSREVLERPFGATPSLRRAGYPQQRQPEGKASQTIPPVIRSPRRRGQGAWAG